MEIVHAMDLLEKIAKVKELQAAGYKFERQYDIVEVYRDKWVYLRSKKEDNVRSIDSIVYEWSKKEHLRIQTEKANSGNGDIVKYFQLHGVMSDKPKKLETGLYSASIMYDGRGTTHSIWNSEIDMMSISVNRNDKNNRINRYGFTFETSISISKRTDTLIDANIVDGVPVMRQCHGWYDKHHLKAVKHYEQSSWAKDMEDALTVFLKEVDKQYSDVEIGVSKSGVMYQVGKNYVTDINILIQEEYGWHRYEVAVEQMEITNGKYRNMSLTLSALPVCISVISKAELMTRLEAEFRKKVIEAKANFTFKY